MLSGVCDHSTRSLKSDTWEHVTFKLLRCHASVDIIDHALGKMRVFFTTHWPETRPGTRSTSRSRSNQSLP